MSCLFGRAHRMNKFIVHIFYRRHSVSALFSQALFVPGNYMRLPRTSSTGRCAFGLSVFKVRKPNGYMLSQAALPRPLAKGVRRRGGQEWGSQASSPPCLASGADSVFQAHCAPEKFPLRPLLLREIGDSLTVRPCIPILWTANAGGVRSFWCLPELAIYDMRRLGEC